MITMVARRDAPNGHDRTRTLGLLCLVTLMVAHGASGQRVKVEPEVLSYPGQTVDLRCAFSDPTGIQLTMISWIYEPKGEARINIAVFHPSFGANYPESPQKGRVTFATKPPTLASPSILITDVQMTDEGKYICEYATYPSGNEQGITSLVMLAKPQNSASTVTVVAGVRAAVVARCESAEGRPAAQISWVTTANGNGTTAARPNGDNTVTVSSEYRMVPRAVDNGKDISCVVTHRTLVRPESFKMKLAVEYPPQVTVVGYDNNWYVGRINVVLTCQATGNPIPTTITWKTLTGEMPDTVVISENKLTVLKVDESVNTTFVCEVKNRLGIGKDQVTANVRDATDCKAELSPSGRPSTSAAPPFPSGATHAPSAHGSMAQAMLASQERLATSQERLATSQERLATSQERVATSQERLAASQDRLAIIVERVATSQDRLAASQERLTIIVVRVAASLERVAVAAEHLATINSTIP